MRRRGAASHDFWIALGVSLSLHVLAGMLFWGTWMFSPMPTVEPEVEWTGSAPTPEKPVQGRGSVKELTGTQDENQGPPVPPVSSDSSVPGQESKAAPATAAGTPSQKPAQTSKTPETATGPAGAQSSDERPIDSIAGETTGFALIPPKVKERPPLLAPDAARGALTGDVLLNVEVLENGSVGKIVLGRSSGSKILDEVARENVSRWRFEPARQPQGQKPVRVLTSIWVRFAKEGS